MRGRRAIRTAISNNPAMPSKFFPAPGLATPEGLVAVGGDLTTSRLLDAYRHGIFPWPTSAGEPLLWWSPDPRAVFPIGVMRVSRRLARRIRSATFQMTCDVAFPAVIEACGTEPGRRFATWLTPDMIAAYVELHRQGYAHSVEAWQGDRLVGGVYGVAVGGLFAAESMFYRVRDASKVALYFLTHHLEQRGYRLFDIQQWTPHTGSLGAIEMPRIQYLRRLSRAVDLPVTFGDRLETPSPQATNGRNTP
ncbi:MAG: leucyl/phenylalanyl-tRNA--protein transferase [Planctomycetota bacterium]